MRKETNVLSEVAIFLAGVLAAGLVTRRNTRVAGSAAPGDTSTILEIRGHMAELETRITGQETTTARRFSQLESRMEEQSARLSEVPSTEQIVGAMEQLLSRTMSSLDDRMTTQAQSIEVLKTTVAQTDSLLERVLESLDSLQNFEEPAELTEELLRPAV